MDSRLRDKAPAARRPSYEPAAAIGGGDGSGAGRQIGYGTPASRLMASPWSTSRKTANIRPASCHGSSRIPSETISVVAPAGGWGTRAQTITPLVRPRESAAAPTRDAETPDARAGPASVKPNTTSAK